MNKITHDVIVHFISGNDLPYNCTQPKLCIPIIDRMFRKMLVGIRFSEIKVDDKIICDGHHRYLASLLADFRLDIVPALRTSATKIVEWKSVIFDEADWDTPANIKMLNEQDAVYNNMALEELIKLLE